MGATGIEPVTPTMSRFSRSHYGVFSREWRIGRIYEVRGTLITYAGSGHSTAFWANQPIYKRIIALRALKRQNAAPGKLGHLVEAGGLSETE